MERSDFYLLISTFYLLFSVYCFLFVATRESRSDAAYTPAFAFSLRLRTPSGSPITIS
jgi:hypothetical protein